MLAFSDKRKADYPLASSGDAACVPCLCTNHTELWPVKLAYHNHRPKKTSMQPLLQWPVSSITRSWIYRQPRSFSSKKPVFKVFMPIDSKIGLGGRSLKSLTDLLFISRVLPATAWGCLLLWLGSKKVLGHSTQISPEDKSCCQALNHNQLFSTNQM